MARKNVRLPARSLKFDGIHIWDSTIVEHKGILYRYALSADEGVPAPKRHEHARLQLAISGDGGHSWVDQGIVLSPQAKGTWPDHVIWTSFAIVREQEPGVAEFVLAFTGRSNDSNGQKVYRQYLGVAVSKNGKDFSSLNKILDLTDLQLNNKGYDVEDVNPAIDVIMAWRDPYLFFDKKKKEWHLFFAAKPFQPHPKGPVGTVGHAIAKDGSFRKWRLCEPLNLPQYYHQLEVPSMIYHQGEYFLFVSTQNNPRMESLEEKEAAFRGYRSKSINGKWLPIYDKTDLILGRPEVYAVSVFARKGHGYWAVGFYPEELRCGVAGTPIVPLHINKKPMLCFPMPS